ncbi:Hypothetical predicted protein [Cloeon dipterum]|uniref:Zinc finger protein Xfin n=1 Tax=Cloeon dipterum TaxID=197152 RepID=A0A8S1CXS7_9INSE|nr:Hypothetical predicted protein [Cloeon dipterum]
METALQRQNPFSLITGIDTDSRESPSCPECFKVFRCFKTYYCHKRKCTRKPIFPKEIEEYSCEKCGKICSTKIGLKRHNSSVHPEKPEDLRDEEIKEFGEVGDVQDSSLVLRSDEEERNVDIYVCLDCGKVCSGQTGYYRHRSKFCTFSEELSKTRRKFCESCDEVLESKTAYRRHTKICGLGLENEIALVNKSRKCHYFKCDLNQININSAGKEMRLFSIPYHSQRAFLERMNIASLAPNIPLFASLRICSNHFPDSAFDQRYRFKKLLRGSLPYDWRGAYSKEEVEEIENGMAYKSGQDILEFIKTLRAENLQREQMEISEEDVDENINSCDFKTIQPDYPTVVEIDAPIANDDSVDETLSVPPKEKICRMCGQVKEGLIGIFDAAGVDMGIPEKIAKVLPIKVCETDTLPHQVCIQCAGGIDFIYQMFDTIAETEKLLTDIYGQPEEIHTVETSQVVYIDTEERGKESGTALEATKRNAMAEKSILLEEELDIKAYSFAFENSKNPLNEVAYSPLFCTLCNSVFDNVDEYVDHHRIYHLKHLLVCTLCQTFYESIGCLREHWNRLHSRSLENMDVELGNGEIVTLKNRRGKYECKHCRKTFNERYIYRAHLADEQRKIKAQNPAMMKCNFCDEIFADTMNKTWHMMRTHEEYTPYQCSMCERKFRLKHSKDIHERAHQREGLEDKHLCNICGKLLHSKLMLRQHMRVHMDPLPCQVCGKMLVPDRLRVHMRRHKDQRPYFCTKCGASFQFAHKLKIHMHMHAESKFSCERCTFKASKKTVLNIHMRELHGVEFTSIIKCSIEGCIAVFETNRELYEHSCKEHSTTGCIQRNILPGTDGYLCRYCEMQFEAPTSYSNHIRKVHAEVTEPLFTCSVCRHETTSLIDLGIHLETHPECRRFQCQQCPLKFSTSRRRGSHEFGTHFRKKKICPECGKGVDNLQDHMNIHKGLRPYKCPTCDLDFARLYNWKLHLAVHLDHRPYKCNYCDTAFRTKVERKRHTKLHTADEIFECDSCSYACTSKPTFRKHTQKHHLQGLPAANKKRKGQASDDFQDVGITVHSIPVHSKREVLDHMNIAYYGGKIPELPSIRICSLHFPASAFDGEFEHKGVLRRKLSRRAVPYDWRTLCSKEEVERIEARTSFRKGDDILQYMDERRRGYIEGQSAPRIEHNYSKIAEEDSAPTYISRTEVELIHNMPVFRIAPGVNVEETIEYTRKIYKQNVALQAAQRSEQRNQKSFGNDDFEVVEEHIYTNNNLDESSEVFNEEDITTCSSETFPEVRNECVTPKEKICRLCGVENVTMIAIYDVLGRRLSLAEKINAALPIHVSEFDDMPSQICLQCVENVDKMFFFHKKITVTDEKLRVMFNIPDPNADSAKKDILRAVMEDVGIGDDMYDYESDDKDIEVKKEENYSDEEQEEEIDDFDVLLEVDDTNDEEIHLSAVEQNKDPAHEAEYAPLVCSTCNHTLKSPEAYVVHQKQHGIRLWHCPLCLVFYSSNIMLKHHWFQIHNRSIRNTTPHSTEVRNIMKKFSSNPTKLICKYCKASFEFVHEYRSHIMQELRIRRQTQKIRTPATIKCDYCDEMHTTVAKKQAHMQKSHTEYKPHQCSFCLRKFRVKSSMKAHEDSHREENTSLCTICGYLCSSRVLLRAHMRKHMDPIPCEICDKVMIPDRLRAHMKSHKLSRPLKCPHCPSMFRLTRHLKQHLQAHTDCRFTCNLCTYSTKRKLIMHSHMRRTHAIEMGDTLMCSLQDCGQVVSSAAQLYEHISKEHQVTEKLTNPIGQGVDSFYCRYCQGTSSTPSTYVSHLRQEHAEVENFLYTCTVCMHDCKSLSELIEHLESHPESLRYQCRQCTRKFVSSLKRLAHESMEHNREWLRCVICSEKVSFELFQDHLETHKSDDSYSTTFTDYDSYADPVKTHGSKTGSSNNWQLETFYNDESAFRVLKQKWDAEITALVEFLASNCQLVTTRPESCDKSVQCSSDSPALTVPTSCHQSTQTDSLQDSNQGQKQIYLKDVTIDCQTDLFPELSRIPDNGRSQERATTSIREKIEPIFMPSKTSTANKRQHQFYEGRIFQEGESQDTANTKRMDYSKAHRYVGRGKTKPLVKLRQRQQDEA